MIFQAFGGLQTVLQMQLLSHLSQEPCYLHHDRDHLCLCCLPRGKMLHFLSVIFLFGEILHCPEKRWQ